MLSVLHLECHPIYLLFSLYAKDCIKWQMGKGGADNELYIRIEDNLFH